MIRIQDAQYQALQDLFVNTGGSNWITSEPWKLNPELDTRDYCGFTGVTCDKNHVVTELDLTSFGLNGTIHDDVYTRLNRLQKINLEDNPTLTGTFPLQSIAEGNSGVLTNLNLRKTGLTGRLSPDALTDFGSRFPWIEIDLGETALSGTIPTDSNRISKRGN